MIHFVLEVIAMRILAAVGMLSTVLVAGAVSVSTLL